MGLKSLAKVNRSGVYDFWENLWGSNTLYRNYLYHTKTLPVIFSELFSFFFFKYLFKRKKVGLGYLSSFKTEFKIPLILYFSKIWVLRYQNWVVLVVYYYNLTPFFRKRGKILNTSHRYNFFFKTSKNYNFKF